MESEKIWGNGSEGETLNGIPMMDPETLRALGYRIVDMIVGDLHADSPRPLVPVPKTGPDMDALFGGDVPQSGSSPDALLDFIQSDLLPNSSNFNSSEVMGYVVGGVLPLSGLLEAVTSSLKLGPLSWIGNPGPTQIEVIVGRWLGEMIGYSDQAAGYITTGGTMANLFGINVARVKKAGWDVRQEGHYNHPMLTLYCSVEGHSCIDKSVELMGLGLNQLRKIPTDQNYRVRLDLLEAAIEEDIAAGHKPFCIIGNGGTVNTGAVDPLHALADLADKYGCWFHIDGAYGAFAAMTDAAKPLFAGLERADSVVLDPHKWLNAPLEAGCVLMKNWDGLEDAFSLIPPYLRTSEEGEGHNHINYGFELTRTDRALKIWLSLKQYGVQRFKAMVAGHIAQVNALAEWVEQADDFELMSAPSLSIVCFRYVPTDLRSKADEPETAEYLNTLNQALDVTMLIEAGSLISATDLGGKRVLRVCIVSYRVTPSAVEEVFAKLQAIGSKLDQQMRPS